MSQCIQRTPLTDEINVQLVALISLTSLLLAFQPVFVVYIFYTSRQTFKCLASAFMTTMPHKKLDYNILQNKKILKGFNCLHLKCLFLLKLHKLSSLLLQE